MTAHLLCARNTTVPPSGCRNGRYGTVHTRECEFSVMHTLRGNLERLHAFSARAIRGAVERAKTTCTRIHFHTQYIRCNQETCSRTRVTMQFMRAIHVASCVIVNITYVVCSTIDVSDGLGHMLGFFRETTVGLLNTYIQ